jgi:hypothetical protein
VVAAAVVVVAGGIALGVTLGSHNSNPTATYGHVFGD